MTVGECVLEARDLGYAYTPERFAIRHLNLTLGRGEILGLLGRNGAGKTTTVRLLTTLLPPTEGTAIVLGQDLRQAGRDLRRHLGVVLQAESLDFVSVERNLTLYAFLWGVGREVAKARAEEMLDLFELHHVRRRKPWALSGGERRRFQVARELMHDMEILFLDEPTVGLDAVARQRILKYLRSRAQGGLSIVFTTHILHEADTLCDRIAVIHQGALTALDTAEGLKQRYGGAREVWVDFTPRPGPESVRELLGRVQRTGSRALPGTPAPSPEVSRFSFSSPDPEGLVADLVQWAQSRSVKVTRLAIREATLEGAFLGIVGGGEEDPEIEDPTPPSSPVLAGAP